MSDTHGREEQWRKQHPRENLSGDKFARLVVVIPGVRLLCDVELYEDVVDAILEARAQAGLAQQLADDIDWLMEVIKGYEGFMANRSGFGVSQEDIDHGRAIRERAAEARILTAGREAAAEVNDGE